MGGGQLTDEIRREILDCLQWDRDRIDEMRLKDPDSENGPVLQAIREHLDQYTELLKRDL
jgi:hypothetical protein